MKFLRTVLGAGALLCAVAGRATPEADVRAAVDNLSGAGNYTWEEKSLIDFDSTGHTPTRTPNSAEGATEIGGFTRMTAQRRDVLLRGNEAAFKLKAGWRHANDLTDDDLGELSLAFPTARTQERMRHYTHVLPHEVLAVLLAGGVRFRKEGAAILADFESPQLTALELESYLTLGVLPAGRARSPLGLPLPRREPRARESADVRLVFMLTRDTLEEFAAEIRRAGNISFDGGPAERHEATRIFRFRLHDIGTTRVDVEPEAKALFLGAGR